jgi:CDP-diacylglycerol--glycerol-3-phosphate 3-phosphatidyltransferase
VDGVTTSPRDPESQRPAAAGQPAGPYVSDRLLTIPNIICGIRLAGSFVLIAIAWFDRSELFLWIYLVLAISDWIDGKLAILLNQRSVFGARLDSWADTALYAALFVGTVMMFGDIVRAEIAWFIPPLAAYVISTAAGVWKYRRWPSYHTRAAKIGWFLIMIAAIGLFTDWSLWPLRIALAFGALTNLEALAITIISPFWRADVTSIYHAWRDNKAA